MSLMTVRPGSDPRGAPAEQLGSAGVRGRLLMSEGRMGHHWICSESPRNLFQRGHTYQSLTFCTGIPMRALTVASIHSKRWWVLASFCSTRCVLGSFDPVTTQPSAAVTYPAVWAARSNGGPWGTRAVLPSAQGMVTAARGSSAVAMQAVLLQWTASPLFSCLVTNGNKAEPRAVGLQFKFIH